MSLLLDTHIFLAIIDGRAGVLPPDIRRLLAEQARAFHVSVASLWEIAIKWRLGKLRGSHDPHLLPELITDLKMKLITINEHHALADPEPTPQTRDPFDRMLLAQCQVEGLRLVTIDRALAAHPLSATAR